MIKSEERSNDRSNGWKVTVKLARSLKQKKNRQESGLFLVEGIHHIGAAIEAGWDVHALLYSEEQLKSQFARKLVQDQVTRGTCCISIPLKILESLADKENPQGILGIIREKSWDINDINLNTYKWGVALISPQDPGNIGSILRSLDCAGGDALFLVDGGVDVFNPACVRASMGALFWKPVVTTTFQGMETWARSSKIVLMGTSAHASLDYLSLGRQEQPLLLVFGNEQKGMSSLQQQACDQVFSLPMFGHASSLNLSVAAGIFMYALIDKKNQGRE